MKCKECKLFNPIANTDETEQGICKFGGSWQPTTTETECPILMELYCGDCDHYISGDSACMTANKNDPVVMSGRVCCGFVHQDEPKVYEVLLRYKMLGLDYRQKIKSILEEVDNTEIPESIDK